MLHLSVADADATVARAERVGATVLRRVEQMYGERSGMIVDPFGPQWFIGTPVAHVSARRCRPVMATSTDPAGPIAIRWLRVLAGGFFIEFLLAAASVPFFASGREADLQIVVPPATLAIAFGLGAWTARRAGGRHLLHGALTGVAAVLFYLLLFAGSLLFAPGQADLEASLSPAYLASHLFKVLGAAAGGWWIARRRAG